MSVRVTRGTDKDARPGLGVHDVVFTMRSTWSAAVNREFSYPEDRLAIALPTLERTRRVLVCDSFRSAPRKAVRAVVKPERSPFSGDVDAAHYSPLRIRREDPRTVRDVARAYRGYERKVQRAAVRHGLVRPAIITANPLVAGFGDFSWAGPVTYYGWDDWATYEPHRRWWSVYQAAFELIRAHERRVVAVTGTILTRIQPTGIGAVVPNGIVPSEWAVLPPPPGWFVSRPSPRLLYVGSLESRIDVEQLRGLANDLPDASITLVGPLMDIEHFRPLASHPNIDIRPRVSRQDLPGLVAHADVALIPHIRSPLTEAMSPLKLYEYLAAGVPVAAVDLPGTRGISDRVCLTEPGTSLTPAVRAALAGGRMPEPERLAFVGEHAWERRFNALLDVALGSPAHSTVAQGPDRVPSAA